MSNTEQRDYCSDEEGDADDTKNETDQIKCLLKNIHEDKAGNLEERVRDCETPSGEGQGLKIAELLEDRSKRGDGTVSLSNADIGDSRIVVENTAEEQALQINAPIGENGWREVRHLEIRNNRATGNSIQLNYGTSMEVFERLLAARQNREN